MGSTAFDLFKKRNNPEYLNWLAVGEALITLNDGLQQYAEREMKDFHASLINKLGGVKCNCSYTLGKKPNPPRQGDREFPYYKEEEKSPLVSERQQQMA